MTALELYLKIKEKYPDFEPEEAQEYYFDMPAPFLTEKQVELLDSGFKVTPNREIKPDKFIKSIVTKFLNND